MAALLEEEDVDETALRNELADLPLGDLQKIRSKIGTKKFDTALARSLEKRTARSFKRANKNRPSEVSSRNPVSRFREVIPVPKKKEEIGDPRFSEAAGKFNKDLFEKSFAFVEDMKKNERKLIEKETRRTRDPERKGKLQRLLQQMDSREVTAARRDRLQAIVRQHKKKEWELAKKGKKPFYIKKSTVKKLELAEKYRQLKKSGRLEKYMSKKRKRNAQREKKKLPQV